MLWDWSTKSDPPRVVHYFTNLYNQMWLYFWGMKISTANLWILSCTRKTYQGCRQPPRLSSDKDRWYGVTWCASWFSYNFMFPMHPQRNHRTLVVPFGGARDATAQQLQERRRKVWERPVGSLNDRSIFGGDQTMQIKWWFWERFPISIIVHEVWVDNIMMY